MKIDFHVHTAERSTCATSLESEQIETAIAQGLDAIAITDHHRLLRQYELLALNQKYKPFRILPGIEITADHEDWLVLGLSDSALERLNWAYADLYRYVRSKNGLIILAHPYRYRPEISADLKQFVPDGIEIHSVNIRKELVPRIQNLADQFNIPTLSNSDAHSTQMLGQYFNIFDCEPNSDHELFSALKSRHFSHPHR
jgi:predicted metal-dependent phosphoesterase TrpH